MMLDECSAAVSWLQLPCDDFDEQLAALLGYPVVDIDSVAKLHRFKQDANCIAHIKQHLRQRGTVRAKPRCRATTNTSWISHYDLVRRLDDSDRDSARIPTETLEWAKNTLQSCGVLCLENLVPPNVVDQARCQFDASWSTLFDHYISVYEDRYNEHISHKGKQFREGDWRGPGRYDVAYGTDEGHFATRHFNDNPLVRAIMQHVLGTDCDVFCRGNVVSLPGSASQTVHFDSPHLIDPASRVRLAQEKGNRSVPGEPFGVLPAHYLTAFINMVDLNDTTGFTAFSPGSHLSKYGGWGGCKSPPTKGKPEDGGEFVHMHPTKGSLVIFDCRIYHYGTANTGQAKRPLYYNLFAKPFFHEPIFGSRSLVEEIDSGKHSGPPPPDQYHHQLAFNFMNGIGAYRST